MAKEKDLVLDKEVEEVKEKTVKIRLFKDNGKYKDDLFVGINGKSYVIQRGVEVEVPVFVAEVIEQSMKQDEKASILMSELAK